jgi:nucleoside-diphosphate-sugar epimerase
MDDRRKKVLITGGSGRIGSYFVKAHPQRYRYRMVDRVAWDEAEQGGPFPGEASVANLSDLEACRQACQGMDAVIHLAANPRPDALLESLLPDNILTTYNMYTAAKEAGVRRFIFASSIHAIDGYPPGREVSPEMPLWPRNLYGVTKCFGEALGIYFAYTLGVPTICLRIGTYWVKDRPGTPTTRDQRSFLAADDLNQALVQSLDANGIQFGIFNVTSDNRLKRMNLEATIRELGYQPQFDSFTFFQEPSDESAT